MATIARFSEVERVVLSRQAVPIQSDQQTGRLIDRLCITLDGEISGHFDFEDLGDLLVGDHVIRNAMNDVVASAGAARAGGFSPKDVGCIPTAVRRIGHIEKEERALIPEMQDALTPEIEAELAAHHDL